ncbi:MAG: hypothetical protein IE934_09855 [Sphingopyxis sp.]|nr:hypothetical protein [Sphingopyxis sp.]
MLSMGTGGLALTVAALQTPPETAMSNAALWAKAISGRAPLWMRPESVDSWATVILSAVLGAMILATIQFFRGKSLGLVSAAKAQGTTLQTSIELLAQNGTEPTDNAPPRPDLGQMIADRDRFASHASCVQQYAIKVEEAVNRWANHCEKFLGSETVNIGQNETPYLLHLNTAHLMWASDGYDSPPEMPNGDKLFNAHPKTTDIGTHGVRVYDPADNKQFQDRLRSDIGVAKRWSAETAKFAEAEKKRLEEMQREVERRGDTNANWHQR